MTDVARSRAAAAELLGAITAFLLGMWVLAPQVASRPYLVLLWWIMVLFAAWWLLWFAPYRLHDDPPAIRGWGAWRQTRTDAGRLRAAWPAFAIFTVAGAVLIVISVLARNPAAFAQVRPDAFAIKLLGYVFFGLAQALIFFSFLGARVRDLLRLRLPEGTIAFRLTHALVTAAFFSLAHFPNPALSLIALVAGFGWALLFQYRPNLLLLGLSHAILGTLLHQLVGLFMRIGPFYSAPETYLLRAVIPGLADLIGNRF